MPSISFPRDRYRSGLILAAILLVSVPSLLLIALLLMMLSAVPKGTLPVLVLFMAVVLFITLVLLSRLGRMGAYPQDDGLRVRGFVHEDLYRWADIERFVVEPQDTGEGWGYPVFLRKLDGGSTRVRCLGFGGFSRRKAYRTVDELNFLVSELGGHRTKPTPLGHVESVNLLSDQGQPDP